MFSACCSALKFENNEVFSPTKTVFKSNKLIGLEAPTIWAWCESGEFIDSGNTWLENELFSKTNVAIESLAIAKETCDWVSGFWVLYEVFEMFIGCETFNGWDTGVSNLLVSMEGLIGLELTRIVVLDSLDPLKLQKFQKVNF